jgi:hypothetical protein
MKTKYIKTKLVFTIEKIVICKDVQNERRLKMMNDNFIEEF